MSEYQHVSISMHDLDELGFFAIMPKNDLDQNLHVIMSCVFVRVFSMFDVLKVSPCLFLPRTSSLSWLYIWFHNNIYRSVKSNFLHFSCQRMPLKVIEHSKTSHICIKLSFTFLLNLMFRRKRIYKQVFPMISSWKKYKILYKQNHYILMYKENFLPMPFFSHNVESSNVLWLLLSITFLNLGCNN